MDTVLLTLMWGMIAIPSMLFVRSVVVIFMRLSLGKPKSHVSPKVVDRVWPPVCIQLAVYRESVILESLIKSVTRIDYPKDKMHIQIIDDSEGEEADLSKNIVETFRGSGVKISYLNRGNRIGYKAGALNYGMERSEEALFAFFDSDYVADESFLKKLVPLFDDPDVGGVQAKWDYLNDDKNCITQLQAGIFHKMFFFEQDIRSHTQSTSLYFGSNAMFRKSALEELGGWQGEPFTSEDLDISYKFHNSRWRLIYEPTVLGSTELPEDYLSYIQQQRRWARGMSVVFRDHFRTMLKRLAKSKFELLESSLIFYQVFMPITLLFPVLSTSYVVFGFPDTNSWKALHIVAIVTLVLPPVFFEVIIAFKLEYRDWRRRLRLLFDAIPLLMGLNSAMLFGILEALNKSKAEFVRTPKRGITGIINRSSELWLKGFFPVLGFMVISAILCFVGLIYSIVDGYWLAIPLFLPFLIGLSASSVHLYAQLLKRAQKIKVGAHTCVE